jgi:hypothetical protein
MALADSRLIFRLLPLFAGLHPLQILVAQPVSPTG